MNHAWEVMLNALAFGKEPHSFRFWPDFDSSPYRETAFSDMNLKEVLDARVGLNPLYRFAHIFGPLFDKDEQRYEELREMLFDVFIHYQSQLDLRSGLTKQEYYIRAMLKDFLAGTHGVRAAEVMRLCSSAELKQILYGVLTLYRAGSSMELFRQVVRGIYPRAIVYRNNGVYREILIYLPQQKNETDQKKLDFLTDMFLDLNYTVYTFWGHHFGIVDVDETLEFDKMIVF